ncbi:hypothetical protein D1007_14865 [Hordeum vulgare]|nr:hypothetical protein D1007_14865 [Hordeum vulgare]
MTPAPQSSYQPEPYSKSKPAYNSPDNFFGKITYFGCGQPGHISRQCPNKKLDAPCPNAPNQVGACRGFLQTPPSPSSTAVKADACRVLAQLRATRFAQTAPVDDADACLSPSPMVNAATDPEAQEQQGSSQPAIEPIYGRTAMPSLARPSRSTSRARPEMPHGRRVLAMATELLRYRPAPDRHDDWLHRIKELITAVGDSAALSCSLRPQPCLANNEEQDVLPPLP